MDALIEKTLKNLPKTPGVYIFKDGAGTVLYVGKAKNLFNRVRNYFYPARLAAENRPKVRSMVKWIRRIEIIEVKTEAEALLLEGRLIKEYKPRYNSDWVDDKRFLLVRVDAQELPRFTLARVRADAQSTYYGPFIHGPALRTMLSEMRQRYGILLGDASPKNLGGGRWQLYDDARAEIYEHPNIVTRDQYRARVARASAFLEGHTRLWREEVYEKMRAAAEGRRYEEAARWRDLLDALASSRSQKTKFWRDPLVNLLDPTRSQGALAEALGLTPKAFIIECFDISHISGSFVVASMVRFENGKPAKTKYRHFKIKGFVGNDDFRSMNEVVGRRYGRLQAEGKPLPDIVLIDGGAGQVAVSVAAFRELGLPINPPLIMGLAKREESFVFSDGRAEMTLPRENEGLRLLQRVRDEAHRFANGFNADLRSRQIKTSILDEIPGVGPKTREKLLSKYPSLEKLKSVPPESLAELIGPALAAKITAYLKKLEKDAS